MRWQQFRYGLSIHPGWAPASFFAALFLLAAHLGGGTLAQYLLAGALGLLVLACVIGSAHSVGVANWNDRPRKEAP